MLAHYFITHFIRKPTPDVKDIWDHGGVPENPRESSDCGAKQRLFASLHSHYRLWLERRKLDALTKEAFLDLLYVLAASYLFGNDGGQICLSTALAPGHPFDFAEAGVAFLQPKLDEGNTGAYIIREPLALELAGFLGRKLDERPLAIRGWELLLRLQLQGTGATVSKDCAALVARVVCVQDLSDCR